MTKRNKKYQSTHESDNRQTTSEFSPKHPKIMSSSGDCLLSLLAVGVLSVSKLIMASTPDSSHIPGGPGISTLDSGCDTHSVINDPPELNRSRSVMKRAHWCGAEQAHSKQATGVEIYRFVSQYSHHGKCITYMMVRVGGHLDIQQITSHHFEMSSQYSIMF